MTLGQRIKQLRTERALQQRQLAEKAALTPSMVSQIESGRLTPSLHTLGKVALLYGAERHVLEAGDSAYLDGGTPHGWENLGSRAARALWAILG